MRVTNPERQYAPDRCDQCGRELAAEDRLWGLCPTCQAKALAEAKPKVKAGQQAPD